MLVLYGIVMLVIIVALLISNRTNPFSALTAVPLVIALIAGFGLSDIEEFATEGLEGIASTVALQVFGILFFTIMQQTGVFDPVVEKIVNLAGRSPVKITLATVLLTQIVALDGDGTATYLIVISAMLPLYRGLGMNPLVLATLAGLSHGVQNMVPWGGPLIRAAGSLDVEANDLWIPLLPVQATGLAAVWIVGYILGKHEARRLSGVSAESPNQLSAPEVDGAISSQLPALPKPSAQMRGDDGEDLSRPKMLWPNVALIVAAIAVLIADVIPASLVFMLATVIMLTINYPSPKLQLEVIQLRAREPLMVATIMFGAGIFLGIFNGSGMMDEIATTFAASIPERWGPWLPTIIALIGTPLTILIDVNSYYFGVLPVLASIAEHVGVEPEAVATASLISHSTVGSPLNLFGGAFWVLIALSGIRVGDHLRFYLPWGCFVSTVMLVSAMTFGLIPLPF